MKKFIRIVFLTILILFTAAAGIAGVIPPYRERYVNKEITIEMVDRKKGKSEDESENESQKD